MFAAKLVFAQLMEHLPLHTFRRWVTRYDGEHKVKRFSCLDQLLIMMFAQKRLRFKRSKSLPTDRSTGVICDQLITLTVFYSKQGYPKSLRRIRFKDPETAKTLVFLTNHLELPALTVCALYKMRWQVELFFKWIKQHLPIKASENAVKSQIGIAVCTYVLVAIVRKRLKLETSMHEILHILSLSLFEKPHSMSYLR